MANYGPSDEVNDVKQFAVTVVDVTTNYDFGAAGYAANAALSILAQGQVQLFGSTSQDFSSYISVTIGGVAVTLDGTGSAFMKRHATDVTKAYATYNMPATAAVYYFKAVFKKTNGAGQITHTWSHTVVPLPG